MRKCKFKFHQKQRSVYHCLETVTLLKDKICRQVIGIAWMLVFTKRQKMKKVIATFVSQFRLFSQFWKEKWNINKQKREKVRIFFLFCSKNNNNVNLQLQEKLWILNFNSDFFLRILTLQLTIQCYVSQLSLFVLRIARNKVYIVRYDFRISRNNQNCEIKRRNYPFYLFILWLP